MAHRLVYHSTLGSKVVKIRRKSASLHRFVPTRFRFAARSRFYSRVLESLCHTAPEREFFIGALLVRIHLIIEMILVDRPCAVGV
jgi:hypothetical protein